MSPRLEQQLIFAGLSKIKHCSPSHFKTIAGNVTIMSKLLIACDIPTGVMAQKVVLCTEIT